MRSSDLISKLYQNFIYNTCTSKHNVANPNTFLNLKINNKNYHSNIAHPNALT